MLGLAQAALLLSSEFVEPAMRVADWFLSHLPADDVCYWDFDDPDIPDSPRETSPAAIATAALLKLAPLGGIRYQISAERIFGALVEHHLNAHGGLADGCYKKQRASRQYTSLCGATTPARVVDRTQRFDRCQPHLIVNESGRARARAVVLNARQESDHGPSGCQLRSVRVSSTRSRADIAGPALGTQNHLNSSFSRSRRCAP